MENPYKLVLICAGQANGNQLVPLGQQQIDSVASQLRGAGIRPDIIISAESSITRESASRIREVFQPIAHTVTKRIITRASHQLDLSRTEGAGPVDWGQLVQDNVFPLIRLLSNTGSKDVLLVSDARTIGAIAKVLLGRQIAEEQTVINSPKFRESQEARTLENFIESLLLPQDGQATVLSRLATSWEKAITPKAFQLERIVVPTNITLG